MNNNKNTSKLIDTHLHLVYPNKLNYSWIKDVPALANADFTIENYQSLVKHSGVAKAIFMETATDDDSWQDETRFVLELMKKPDNPIAGIVSSCRPELDEKQFDRWLEATHGDQVVGYRRVLHIFPDEMSQTELFKKNIKKIGAVGKTFDLCVLEKQLPIAINLAKFCPDTKFILNHCGIPEIGSGNMAFWKLQITELAQLPNVFCKISGVVAYCPAGNANAEVLRPYMDHCIESFGWERLVWGSDWPVCNLANGVSHWLDVFQELISQESDETQNNITFNNAASIYNLT